MIRIKSKRAGFRRCGIAHPDKAAEYPDDRFSAAELAILKAEPMLVVEVVKGANDDISALTVVQLTAEIAKFQPTEPLKGVKKAELIDILKAHRDAAEGKE